MPSNTKGYTPLSVVMIVKNEEHRIRKCLEAVAWADEIVVLDTGSQDNTPQTCAELGAKVYHLDKWEGFGKARQRAVSLASNDWVFSLDADEIVSSRLQQAITTLRNEGFGDFIYRVKVQSYYLNKAIRFCGWQNEWHNRIFNRRESNFNAELVHETVLTSLPAYKLQGTLHHYTYPTKAMHKAKMELYGKLGAEKMAAAGKKSSPAKAVSRACFTFIKMFLLKGGVLDGLPGFKLCVTTAWGTWYKYHTLWKLNKS